MQDFFSLLHDFLSSILIGYAGRTTKRANKSALLNLIFVIAYSCAAFIRAASLSRKSFSSKPFDLKK